MCAGLVTAASPLPPGARYDEQIPAPESVFGFSAGEWHLVPEAISGYLRSLADASPRVTFEVQGTTHEGRPQPLLVIASEKQRGRLEETLSRRAKMLADPDSLPAETSADEPVIVWLGFSIHGNEASGSNAAPWVAYHLAASLDDDVLGWLDNTIVLIDPMLNPDGLSRFATWANMHRGSVVVDDPWHREHREGWPSGRTNHYWFDLNRDWLPVQHPESRARLATYRKWLPNVSGDYHEMGSDGTYFFQPGVPSRENPLKPDENIVLTKALAEDHAAALDEEGEAFYRGQTFDDFYPGKGSTYPDIAGGVGVLFEQASARGHAQETAHRRLTFQRAIRNHWLTSISLISGTSRLRDRLIRYQLGFFQGASEFARDGRVSGWVIEGPADRTQAMVDALVTHGIRVRSTDRAIEAGQRSFPAGSVWVPADQPHARLVRSVFSSLTAFADDVFYDVSAWTFPHAFGLQFAELPAGKAPPSSAGWSKKALPALSRSAIYVLTADSLAVHAAVARLSAAGASVALTRREFTPAEYGHSFPQGCWIVRDGTRLRGDALFQRLSKLQEDFHFEAVGISSSASTEGIDLGSPDVVPLQTPRIALVAGPGVSSYETGELWFLLDQRMQLEVTLLEPSSIGKAPLSRYTHLLLPGGNYSSWTKKDVGRVEDWVRAGGTLIAQRTAARQVGENWFGNEASEEERKKIEAETTDENASPEVIPWSVRERSRAKDRISGAVFQIEIDLTHPLAAGYTDKHIAVWRQGVHVLPEPEDAGEVFARYTKAPRLAGYASAEHRKGLAGTPAVLARREGRGTVVRFADNPAFRGYWMATQKLYLNAIFASRAFAGPGAEEDE
jgi:hypothetical protein